MNRLSVVLAIVLAWAVAGILGWSAIAITRAMFHTPAVVEGGQRHGLVTHIGTAGPAYTGWRFANCPPKSWMCGFTVTELDEMAADAAKVRGPR